MTATPKHRLRATVTYTLEMDADVEHYGSGIRALAASVKDDIDNGYITTEDFTEAATKVEVVR